jgi:hypothetical protein
MKKIVFSLFLFTVSFLVFGQSKTYRGTVYDGLSFYPIREANIYNFSSKKYSFSDQNGKFSIEVNLNDTLIISKSIYRQLMLFIDQEIYNKEYSEIIMYYKAIILKEVAIYAINPSYDQFIKEVVNTSLPDVYSVVAGTKMTKQDFMNNKYSKGDYNVLSGTPMGSPLTYFYEKYNKKYQNIQLAKELNANQDEVDKVPGKYNRELVSSITGLKGDDLLNFMMYCRFGYYDIIKMTSEQIIMAIRIKYSEYEYYKILQEE